MVGGAQQQAARIGGQRAAVELRQNGPVQTCSVLRYTPSASGRLSKSAQVVLVKQPLPNSATRCATLFEKCGLSTGLLNVNMLDQATSIRAERNIPSCFVCLGARPSNSDTDAPLTPAQLKLAVANMLWRDKNLADLQNPAAAIANLGILGRPQIWTAPQTFQGGGTTVDTLTVGRGSGAVAGNVVLGNSALTANVAGVYNTAIGNGALEFVRGIGMRDPETHNGSYNTAIGSVVLQDNIEGIDNTGVGNIALWHNQGDGNTALGSSSLSANTTGNFNTGVGTSTLPASTTGSNNFAAGYSSLYRNTTGTGNVATGSFSLNQNTTGSYNTGLGYSAVWGNTSGNSNVGVGDYALYTNAAGSQNVAVGSHALYANDHGTGNTALGYAAAQAMTAGGFNTAEGNFALGRDTTGSSNVADGNFALGGNTTGSGNSAVGNSALAGVTTGGNNVALGNNAGSHITTGNDNLVLGPNTGASTLTVGTGNILIGAGKPVDTVDGTTNNEINIAGLLFYNKATNGAPRIRRRGLWQFSIR